MSEEIQEGIVVSPQVVDALALTRMPDVVLEEAHKAAKALMSVIDSKKDKFAFRGKTYLTFEDWQTVARFYGITAIGTGTKYIEYGEVKGFEAGAQALLVSTNQPISSAEAMCLNDEQNWRGKPLFQLKSMAQTRACAKALRNVLSWVVVLAGYSGTPAEEMDGVGPTDRESSTEKSTKEKPLLNATQQRAFWAGVKAGAKTETEVRDYLLSIGIPDAKTCPKMELAGKILKINLDDAIKWAAKPSDLTQELHGSVEWVKANKKMWACAGEAGIPEADVRRVAYESYKVDSMKKLTAAQLDAVTLWIEGQKSEGA